MGQKNKTKQLKAPVFIVVSTICAIALTVTAYNQIDGMQRYAALAAFAILLCSQILLYKSVLVQKQRLDRYHQVSRKLLHAQTKTKRDERHALKILNHINSIPDQSPTHASIWQKPLRSFSGDLALACESSCGKKYTLLADLTGHGIAAAMGAAPVASIFEATAKRGLSVAEIITEMNNRLEQLLPSGFFCSTALVMIDGDETTVCNAGLPDILIANESGVLVDRVTSEQLPLGIQSIEISDVQLFTKKYQSPHQLYAFTDGLIETTSANDEIFDLDKLAAIITNRNQGSGRIGNITECFEAFAKDSPLSDDISIVEVMIC